MENANLPLYSRYMRKLVAIPTIHVTRHALLCALATSAGAQIASDDIRPTERTVKTPSSDFVNTAVLAVPNAEEIVLDLPSALHWSLHQRGTLGSWSYVFYPDGSAKIMDGAERPRVKVTMQCKAGISCRVKTVDGTDFDVPVGAGEQPSVPDDKDLDSVTRYLAKWILAGTAPPPPSPDVDPVADPSGRQPEAADVVPLQETAAPDETAAADAQPATPDFSPPVESEPVCSEVEPYVPTACAQPTEPLQSAVAATDPAGQSPQGQGPAEPATAAVRAEATPIEDTTVFDRYKVNCSVTGSSSLSFLNMDPERRGVGKPRVSLGCSAALTDRLSIRLSLIRYLIPDQQQPWDPDYTYAFSYRVNDSITLGYSNYSARFTGGGNAVAGLLNGNLRGSYRLPVINLPNDKKVPCPFSLGLPNPIKESANLSCGYAVTDKLRVSATASFYMPGEQDTYQPDYSYTASYRINDDWLLSYNNYSNNRWPWNKGEDPGPGLTGGSLSLTYKFKF